MSATIHSDRSSDKMKDSNIAVERAVKTNVNKTNQERDNDEQQQQQQQQQQKKDMDDKLDTQELDFRKSADKPFIINSSFYILIIIFVGLPMWFYTCSVTRYSIPELESLEKKLETTPRLHLDISIVQFTNDHNLPVFLRSNLNSELDTNQPNVSYHIDYRVRRPTDQEVDLFQAHVREHFAQDNAELSENLQKLEINLLQLHKPSNRFRQFIYLIDEPNYSAFCDSSRAHTYSISFERFVYLCPSTALAPTENHQIVLNLIKSAIKEIYSDTVDPDRLKNSMNSKMDLVISFLPELDRISFEHLQRVDNLVHNIYDKNVKVKFPELTELIDITTLTQYLFDVLDQRLLDKILISHVKKTNLTTSDSIKPRVLKSDQLNQLFQKFESRITERTTPNVHNVLYIIPDSDKPTMVLEKDSSNLSILEARESSTLIIPSDERSMVLGLRALVRRVVGLASPNLCENCIVRRDVFFNRWEIDAITGALTVAKLETVLQSLRSISLQVVGIKIPKDVSAMVSDAHELALDALSKLERKETLEAYRLASKSYQLSELAFFNPSLIESLYFPDEFKYAIYMPIFIPLAMPILTSIFRLIKALLKSLRSL